VRDGRCPSCFGERIGHLESVPDRSRADAGSYQAVGSMSYQPTWAEKNQKQEVVLHKASQATITKAGTVEVLVCADCGRLESYVQDPQWAAFERLYGFSWVTGSEPGGQG
jgi:hypothetical protein